MKRFLLILVGAFLIIPSLSHASHEDMYIKDVNEGMFGMKGFPDLSLQFTQDITDTSQMSYATSRCGFHSSETRKKLEAFPANSVKLTCNLDFGHLVTFKSSDFVSFKAKFICFIPTHIVSDCNKIKVSHVNSTLRTENVPVRIIYNH